MQYYYQHKYEDEQAIFEAKKIKNEMVIHIGVRNDKNGHECHILINEKDLPKITGQFFMSCDLFFDILKGSSFKQTLFDCNYTFNRQIQFEYKESPNITFSIEIPAGKDKQRIWNLQVENEFLRKENETFQADIPKFLSRLERMEENLIQKAQATVQSRPPLPFLTELEQLSHHKDE